MSDDTFNVLSFVHEQRMQHGLKRNDFSAYVSYCNRRLSALRFKASGRVRKHLTPYQKANLAKKKQSNVKGPAPHLPPKISSVDNLNSLQTLIFLIERNWATSQQIRSQIETMNFSISAKKRHSLNKLNKSVAYAKDLFDMKPQLTFAIYYQLLKGEHCNYKMDHAGAYVSFSIVMNLLENLKEFETDLSQFDNYLIYFNELSGPLFNYSKFLLESQNVDLSSFDEEINSETSSLVNTFSQTQKSGYKFKCDDDTAYLDLEAAEEWKLLIETEIPSKVYEISAKDLNATFEAEEFHSDFYKKLVEESAKLQNIVSQSNDISKKNSFLIVLKLIIRRKAAQKEAKYLEMASQTKSLRKICDFLLVCDDSVMIIEKQKTRYLKSKLVAESHKYSDTYNRFLHKLAEVNHDNSLVNRLAEQYGLDTVKPTPTLPEAPKIGPNPILFDLASDLLPSEEELNAGLVNKLFGMFKK